MNSYKANLDMSVSSSGFSEANSGLKEIEERGERAERATDGVTGAFKRALAPIAAFVSVTAGLKKIVDVTRQYEVFDAQLQTATGSAKNASVAFEALEAFAARTPYELEQSVDAFVKLTNLGLKPSERALTSYGDTAAAMGKDLTQFIEAVADATTNEFERLKEFGIKASQQGDNVAFTFRGVTTTVKKNADDIEEYLTRLGENNFAGAMAKRMDSLDGAISNLGDTWDALFRNVGQQGLGDVITEGVRTATEAIEELDAMISSGQIAQMGNVLSSMFEGYGQDASTTFDLVNSLFMEHAETIGASGQSLTEFLTSSLQNLPANVRALVQIMTVELAAFIDKTAAYGTEILENLQFWKDETFDLDAQLENINTTRLDSIEGILKERDTAVQSTEIQIEKARSLREAYDQAAKSRKTATLDDVSTPSSSSTPEEPSGPDAASQRDFDKLLSNVIPPADRINEVFEKRLQLIRENTEEGSEKQAELIQRLNEQYATDVLNGFEVQVGEYDFSEKLRLVEEEFQARHELIMANTEFTELQRTELEKQLATARMQQIANIEQSKWDSQLGVAKGALGNLATLMNSESEKAFKIGKIAAIARATIAGIEATVHSYNFGSEIGGPVLGAAFAATAAAATLIQIQQIRAQQFNGGGTVSAGASGGSTPNAYQPSQPTQPTGPTNPAGENSRPVQFIFNGDVSGVDAESIAQMLKDHIDQTDFVLIESTSRNGQELAA